jgi:hypothetical protein
MYHRSTLSLFSARQTALTLGAVILMWFATLASPVLAVNEGGVDYTGDDNLVDVGLLIFDPGIPTDKSTHSRLGIFPEIRKSEAKYMPVILRQVLIESGDWGVVRVLPEVPESSDLLITGTIVHSDGQRLELRITARDAIGVLWLDQVYTGATSVADYPVAIPGDPYLSVFQQIASDLQAGLRQQSSKQRATIKEVALMRYASGLAPEVFGSYLTRSEAGEYQLLRLPATGDPMLARVIRIREQEYLFIDTVDEQYARLSEEMAPTYNLWRQFGAEQAVYRDGFQQRVSNRESLGHRGSFVALEQTYNAYKLSKIHEQDLDELALGFNNEVAPTVMEVSGTVFKLSGSLDSQYTEWRDILRKIFILEMGLAPAS